MHDSQPVTTYTAMSSDIPGQGTNTLWTTVRETLASALEHVDAMEAGRQHLTVVGGTASGKVIRYAWHGDPQARLSRAHDMVMIIKEQDSDDGSDQCEECGWERRHCICS